MYSVRTLLSALCAFFFVLATTHTQAQSCLGNIATNASGYYGGFEAGAQSIAAGAGSTDLSIGSNHGAYQVINDANNLSDAMGGGYLKLKAHSGNYLMLIHTDNSRLWYKSVNVTAGQTYTFCAWIASAKAKPANGFEVRLRVKYGNTTSIIATATALKGDWSQICGSFTVPAGVSAVEFQLVDPFPDTNVSNFLVLDDICIRSPLSINPDINATYVNVPVTGSVYTNDIVPNNTAYGTPVPAAANPGGATLTVAADGTYTFTPTAIGVYVYHVPVCPPSGSGSCSFSVLTITVLQKAAAKNAPVANTDLAQTKTATAVVINTLANDAPGSIGGMLNPATVSIISNPKNGSAVINSITGAVTYTPAAGFAGNDTLVYSVCDKSIPTPLCATALQIISVKTAGAANTTSAGDDYAATTINTAVSGDVTVNDNDAGGNAQTVTSQNTSVSGKGTLVLNANGTFTYTPVVGFTGPVSFVYSICDNGMPQACANATLYILVQPVASLSALPVNLAGFAGQRKGENVQLAWETAAESNSSHFTVQHSTDGATWTTIGKVTAVGNSNSKKAYDFLHTAPAKGKNFYRLQLVDKNNSTVNSQVISVQMTGEKVAINNVFPNPFVGNVQLSIYTQSAAIATIQLFDMNGSLVRKQDQNMRAGDNSISLTGLDKLSKGTYLLKVTVGEVVLTQKLFRQD